MKSAILWDESLPFPPLDEIPLPDRITHTIVERAREDGYHYLHETAFAFHRNEIYLGWANGREKETNTEKECYRGKKSSDGGRSWSEPFMIAPEEEGVAHNHGVMLSHNDALWCFVARHDNLELTGTEGYLLNESSGAWESKGIVTSGFIPFDTPKRLPSGGWIIAGEDNLGKSNPAVAISENDDFSSWEVVTIPHALPHPLICPETTVFTSEDGLLTALTRHQSNKAKWHRTWHSYLEDSPETLWILKSTSVDNGRTWIAVQPTNLPAHPTKPMSGRLSTGQPFLVFNAQHPTEDAHKRNTLAIAVGRPGADTFCKVWRIRHGESPAHSFYKNTQWSYPFALEHEGHLWISYSVNKSDYGFSILPLDVLAVK